MNGNNLDCNHKLVLQFDIYESEPHIYLVTELLPDGDLFDCIVKNRCFPEAGVRVSFIRDKCHVLSLPKVFYVPELVGVLNCIMVSAKSIIYKNVTLV